MSSTDTLDRLGHKNLLRFGRTKMTESVLEAEPLVRQGFIECFHCSAMAAVLIAVAILDFAIYLQYGLFNAVPNVF